MARYVLSAIACFVVLVAPAAGLTTFVGSATNPTTGSALSASAAFLINGSNLQITLSNTSAADVLAPTDVLTAVFFNLPGNPVLSRESVVLADGSAVRFGGTDPGNVVGGEWAYKAGLSVHNGNQGVSSIGAGLFGPGDRFPGNNLSGPASPDGLQYGLTSMGDNLAVGNAKVTGSQPLIQYSVLITLGNLPVGISESSITNVWFQYGTDLKEIGFEGHREPPPAPPAPGAIPEPLTVLACAMSLVGLRVYKRRD